MILSYCRVSTDRQDIGLDAQKAAIDAWCAQWAATHGLAWLKPGEYIEKRSGKNMNRPELQKAIAQLEYPHGSNDPAILVVAKLDRLSRSVADFAALVDRANKNGWSIVVCDLNIDMTTPSGRLIANIMASLAEWERSMIGLRIKEALAEKRKQGIRPGRPVDAHTALRIRNWSDGGMNLHEIARHMNFNNIPTAWGGKKWYATTVRNVLRRA